VDGRPDVLVIAGEHSGDEHAARMVARLLEAEPGRKIAAVGGERLRGASAQLLHDLTSSSVVGLVEVLRHYGYFRRLFAALVDWIREHRPRVVCLVDYPGLNLRLAAALREHGISRAGGGEGKGTTIGVGGFKVLTWPSQLVQVSTFGLDTFPSCT
jgi:lipid-A-disaccharide synthase